ncbi:MAG: PEP-utilizing enzyme [Alphaproteobacteria bacterium]
MPKGNGASPRVAFGTKAETLERLAPLVTEARVLPALRFTAGAWQADPSAILASFRALAWAGEPAIVRSSALSEDAETESNAGRFLSIGDVRGEVALSRAIGRVIASFGTDALENQVFVQPYLREVALSGVAFTIDPNTGGPYFVVNYDDRSKGTTSVTAGSTNELKTFVMARALAECPAPALGPVIAVARELEALLGHDRLDIEFAIGADGKPVLLQVRPLVLREGIAADATRHTEYLSQVEQKIAAANRPHPYLFGERTLFGVMPDWNPAEIIGIRPRPLALSLYKDLITDSIWAYQRDNYGYKNLRSFPLLVSLHGLPYIDVRVSFNSFVPADIDGDLGARLVNYYLDRLEASPSLHDKVEFDIIFSCYTIDLKDRLAVLGEYGFSAEDRETLADSLRRLTNRIIHSRQGLWYQDLQKLKTLQERHRRILDCDMDRISRIYWILEDCKRYGTLPFAGLARAGFIAVQFLRSLVSAGVFSASDYHAFIGTLNTVSSRLTRDLRQMDRTNFLAAYGHLRPGTYDILSPRYDEAPDLYFDWAGADSEIERTERFALSLEQMRCIHGLLEEHGLNDDVVGLFNFLQSSIEGREYAKFLFTRHLSDAISLIKAVGEEYGFSAEDMAYADIAAIRHLHSSSDDAGDILRRSIEQGRQAYARAQQIVLPPLLGAAQDVWAFHIPATEPNFITQKSVTARVVTHDRRSDLPGSIVVIPNADPGFDWLFSHRIAGLVTAYGGVNSHMAIRAGELGIPAVIGAGETLFRSWSQAMRLHVDCANRRVEILGGSARESVESLTGAAAL